MAKSCKKGYYYCYTSKKCKKIPKGYHVMPTGMLMRDSEHKDEETNGKKKNGNGANGDGNGNGDSSGGSDGGGVSEAWSTKYKRSIDCDSPKGFSQRAHCQGRKKVTEEKKEGCDHEVVMARKQVKKSMDNLKKLARVLAKKSECDDLPAWIQAKITDTEHNTDAAAGYIDEARKSGDYSLRDWFTKSRASDGTPGWVQLGGKYAGKPCAKQPGQKTKPKCGSSKMKANLSDKEEEYAFRSKNRKDKNPNRKGAPINVATEKKKKLKDSYSNWRHELEDLHEIPALVAAPLAIGGVALAGRAIGGALNRFVDNQRKGQHRITAKQGNPVAGLNASRKRIEGAGRNMNQSFELEGEVVSEGKPYKVGDTIPASATKPQPKKTKFNVDKNDLKGPENPLQEGKKDACYHKVKSRYKVWPSAYASGALVKCREVGAKNWGNKKEGFSNWREDILLEGLEDKLRGMSQSQIEDLIKNNKGAEKKIRDTLARMRSATPRPQGSGPQMPTNFAKQGVSSKPRTVNVGDYANRNVPGSAWQRAQQNPSAYRPGPGVKPDFSGVNPTPRPRSVRPNVRVRGGGKFGLIKALAGPALAAGASVLANVIANQQNRNSRAPKNESFDNWKDNYTPTEIESVDIIKAEPLRASDWRTELNIIEDWQKSNRKDGVDGMSQKSVNAYKRENPGSKLQTAVTEKKPKGKRAKRRKSFCARSKGQKDMHNIDCSKTPEKKICKARKRWRC